MTETAPLLNGIIVKYTDPEGNLVTVGPPGSKTDYQEESLGLPHPALTAHRIKAYALLELDGVTTRVAAAQTGALWLHEQRRLAEPPPPNWMPTSGGQARY